MLSPLHYLHHRPAARHGGLLELPRKPSPLGQVCMLQAQVSQILCINHLCAETLWPAHWLLKRLLVSFCRDKKLECISEVFSPTSRRDFSHTTLKGSHVIISPALHWPTHVEGTSHTQVCEY